MKPLRRAAFTFARWNRNRKARFALEVVERLNVESVLLVGVSDRVGTMINMVERQIAERVTFAVASGLADNAGWDRYVVSDGRRLPFADHAFDLVYANAVIEHVGGPADQKRFLDEVDRVGRTWIVTTPNKWFPVEAHYHTLFSHWRESWSPRGTVTRLLGKKDLQALSSGAEVRGLPFVSPTLSVVGWPEP